MNWVSSSGEISKSSVGFPDTIGHTTPPPSRAEDRSILIVWGPHWKKHTHIGHQWAGLRSANILMGDGELVRAQTGQMLPSLQAHTRPGDMKLCERADQHGGERKSSCAQWQGWLNKQSGKRSQGTRRLSGRGTSLSSPSRCQRVASARSSTAFWPRGAEGSMDSAGHPRGRNATSVREARFGNPVIWGVEMEQVHV